MDHIITMGFAWMISGILLLIINRSKNSSPVWLGSSLILVFGLTLVDSFLKPGMLPKESLRIVFLFSRNSYFLIGPFLLLYTRSLLFHEKIKASLLLHLIPYVLMVLISIFNPSSLIPLHELPDGSAEIIQSSRSEIFWVLLSILSRGIYSFLVIRLIHQQVKKVPDYYSHKSFRNTLSWLYYLVVFYLILFILNFIMLIMPPVTLSMIMIAADIVRMVPSLLFIFLFSLFAQNQHVPEDRQKPDADVITDVKEEKYKNSVLSSEESQRLYEELYAYLSESRIFLDPDLTLNTLADKMEKTRHHLSEVINRESNENFYTYINGFRLRAFLYNIQENLFPNYTIMAIALECGFKSTSAFYKVFKKSMGKTPKEYMKDQSQIADNIDS